MGPRPATVRLSPATSKRPTELGSSARYRKAEIIAPYAYLIRGRENESAVFTEVSERTRDLAQAPLTPNPTCPTIDPSWQQSFTYYQRTMYYQQSR